MSNYMKLMELLGKKSSIPADPLLEKTQQVEENINEQKMAEILKMLSGPAQQSIEPLYPAIAGREGIEKYEKSGPIKSKALEDELRNKMTHEEFVDLKNKLLKKLYPGESL